MIISNNLKGYLEDLESRIDPEVERHLLDQWVQFTYGNYHGGLFLPARRSAFPTRLDWPSVTVNQALDDLESMALQQYRMCSAVLDDAGGALMCVRGNYGSSILPSLFGVEIFIMEDSLDTLPSSRPLEGGIDAIKSLLDRGVPNLRGSLGGKALRASEMFVEIGQKYPRIGEFASIYHPDAQGPMDACRSNGRQRHIHDRIRLPGPRQGPAMSDKGDLHRIFEGVLQDRAPESGVSGALVHACTGVESRCGTIPP